MANYADGFDGPERDWKPEGPRAKACTRHGEPPVSGFGLPEETFMIVICSRNMWVIIARKQAFPKPSCIGHEIGYERLIVFVDIRFLNPVQ